MDTSIMETDLTKNVETRVKINSFKFRDYQVPIVRAIENDGYKKLFICMPRRAGKDVCLIQCCLRQLLRRTMTIFYIFPTFNSARMSIWNGLTISGKRILDYFPDEICKKNSSEMRINLLNGSVLQFLGSTEYSRLRGTNPHMVVFSEYAYQNPMAYETIRPVLLANKGIAVFVSTPFAKNHFWDLYQIAQNSDDWFCYRKTIDETMHISQEDLMKEKLTMSNDMFMQEYYVSFEQGVAGSVFAKIMNDLRLNNQITNVPWERGFSVHTSWDLGFADYTVILFFQIIGNSIHIIDMYEQNQEGLEHYIDYLDTKSYKYGKHIAPHDIANHSFSTGVSRIEMASNLGVDFVVAPKLPVADSIEAAKVTLSKCYIDKDKCKQFIKYLNLYRYEWDDKKQRYKNKFHHGRESHSVDAFKYLATALPKVSYRSSPEQLNERYNRVVQGNTNGNLPRLFR